VQTAFIHEQAAQCGYCLNGMIMTTKALLAINPRPSEHELREALRYKSLPLRRPCRDPARGECAPAGHAVEAAPTDGGGGILHRIARGIADRCRSSDRRFRPARPDSKPSSGSPRTVPSALTNGHVDLGTGIRTAPRTDRRRRNSTSSFARPSSWCSATPRRVPNQGATIASETIQITAGAAAQGGRRRARQFLPRARAAERLDLAADELSIEDGPDPRPREQSQHQLWRVDRRRRDSGLELADDVPVKAVEGYSIVGQSVPRRRSAGGKSDR